MMNKERYKAVCCVCGNVFYASKSIAQEWGVLDGGHGDCPKCNEFLNLTFDCDKQEMKTTKWSDWVSIQRKMKENANE